MLFSKQLFDAIARRVAKYALLLALMTSTVLAADTATLPRYDVNLRLCTQTHRADFTQTISWTNRAKIPTRELVVNFYPHYSIPEGDNLLLAKTLELLRLNPRDGIDPHGRAGQIRRVSCEGQALEYFYRHDNPTAFTIKLPKPVFPGESVTVSIEAIIALPNKQGRWGHWHGIHYLTNALPVVAFFDDQGWHAMPFVPWHQPFWNEAGHYTAKITLPAEQKLAVSAKVKSDTLHEGMRTYETEPFLGRDFAIVCSADFVETITPVTLKSGKVVTIKCQAFEKHKHYAEKLSQFVAEAMPVYSEWFGDYPYEHFTIAESYFGWNGNECSGLVLIDERVFNAPHLASGYVEYLVSHETCHQWWYNLVGTNGYAETFIDEGAATYFTHRMLDRKHGDRNNAFMHWPEGLKWLPNINRHNYRNASLMAAIGKNETQPAAGELPSYGHLIGLFNGAYDRGSKTFGMIEARLGEAAFMDFIKEFVEKNSFQVTSVIGLKQELAHYTGKPWDEFFENWVYGKGTTDWKVSRVWIQSKPNYPTRQGVAQSNRTFVEFTVSQHGAISEPTSVGFKSADGSLLPIRLAVHDDMPQRTDDYDFVHTTVDGKDAKTIRMWVDGPVTDVVIDPDHVLVDRKPGNNYGNYAPRFSFTPVYTMLNESDLTNDFDRWNIGGGPWIGGALYPDPWYIRSTMIGARAAAYRTQIFNGGVYGAYRTDYRDIVIGADGLLDHQPYPNAQLGFNVERRVAGPFGNVDGNQATRASAYARHVHAYGSSLYLPPAHYTELYTSYQDNFLPFSRTSTPDAVRPSSTFLGGVHHRINLYTPYWDPESGYWLDLVYGGGVAQVPRQLGMNELRGEFAFVKKFPEWCILGPLHETRLAMRFVGMGALPEQGQFFALGGGTLFRGYDLAQRQGSALWVSNVELRFPIVRDVEWDILDRTVGARNVWLATFYDVGAVYLNGKSVGNVAHALGAGIRIDTALFSFIERATFRFDVGKTISDNTPMQYWFGVQHSF